MPDFGWQNQLETNQGPKVARGPLQCQSEQQHRALSVIAAQQAEVLKSERTVTSGEGSRRHADREHTGSSRRQLEADRDHTQERCSRLGVKLNSAAIMMRAAGLSPWTPAAG